MKSDYGGKVMKLTAHQKVALEHIRDSKVCSPIDCYRHAYDALVKKGIAVKGHNGRAVTYSLPRTFNNSKFDISWERDRENE
jgi:hypothetical protein